MIEPGIYKDVMSSFPSGVTVVTTLDPDGGIVGITASPGAVLPQLCVGHLPDPA
jgi:flavin reductase (DIM6/NTAB) family NADH-FMN oxidoreductase RutF